MSIPMLDLLAHHEGLEAELRQAFDRILAMGRFVLPSPEVETFEQRLAQVCGTRWAVALSSGTDALLAALMALGIGPGDEVITTPFTFFATTAAIVRVGARPVFVDIDPQTFNLDPQQIEPALTARTRAILPVHLFGQTADMEPILRIAGQHRLFVIEDAAQAIGAREGDRPAGSMGTVGCLSFYPTKNLGALGEAGACVGSDPELGGRLRQVRVHGQVGEYEHRLIGGNFRIDVLQAALLNVKLPHLEEWTAARRRCAQQYHQMLGGLPIGLPLEKPGRFHVYNQYTIRVPAQRDPLRDHLASRGISSKVFYPLPMHLQPCFEFLGGRPGQFPQAEKAAREVLSLPIYPELSPQKQERVVKAIREFFGHG